jgi:molybdopterin/thiamine biosynthesis adenylyltransferase
LEPSWSSSVAVGWGRCPPGSWPGQVLFDERDVQAGRPKALAAAERLRAANPIICIEPVVARLTRTNADRLLKDAHLVLNGTDNDATRHLINRK